MSKKVELISLLLRYTYIPLASWEYAELEEKITQLRAVVKPNMLTPENLDSSYMKGRNLAKTNSVDSKFPFEVTAYRKVFPKKCVWTPEEILSDFFPEKQPVFINVNSLNENSKDEYFESDIRFPDDYNVLLEARTKVKQRRLPEVNLDWLAEELDFLIGTIDLEIKEHLFNLFKLEYELAYIEPENIIWYGQVVGKHFEKRFMAERLGYHRSRINYYFSLGESLIKKYESSLEYFNEQGRDWVESVYQRQISRLNITLDDLTGCYN